MRINNKYTYFIILFILLGIIFYLYQAMQSSVTSTPLNDDTSIINSNESDTNTGDYQSNTDSGNLSSDVNKPYTFLYSSELVNKKEDKVPGNIDYAEFVTTTEAYSHSLYQMPGIYLYFYPFQKDLGSWFNDRRAINVGELSQEKLFIADNPQGIRSYLVTKLL